MRNILLKNHTQNVEEKLFSELFLKNQKITYLWINSLKIYKVCSYCMRGRGKSKYIETKLQTTFFHLM